MQTKNDQKMVDENWQTVREIFDSALRRKPEERQNYLIAACKNDETLLHEVESLLSSLDSAEDFMETPAVTKVADIIEAEMKKLETGKCFGHFEIIRQIGSGGMGEVYLAEDKNLDRRVAVKILNEKFSGEESNLQRFIREAKAASALNHPNILTIYEIGESDNTHYIVSEFINGKTLREVFKEKTLKLSEVLDISIQIANALSAAHEANLIHRDIKPENIMMRPDGFVKVLDFGLAKLVEKKNKSVLGLEELTLRQNETAKGLILGTVNYMSPEQAKGERVDERTDIFSLGITLYEMITSRMPFAGNSMSETFANLINAEPKPLAHFASNVPNELQRIVSKMLGKKRDERYQTMQDLLTDLKDLKEGLSFAEKLERSALPEDAATFLQATTGEANKKLEKYPTDEGGQMTSFKALLSAYSGDVNQVEREIRDALEKGKGFGHFHHTAHIIACAYAVLNKPEEAVRYLQMAADDGFPCYPLFASDVNLDAIRQNPKFQSFLAEQKRDWEYYKSLAQF